MGGEQFFSGLARREQRLVGLILEILTNGPARTPSLREAEEADAVFILGEDVPNRAPRLALALRQSVRRGPMAAAGKLHIPSWDDIAVREALQQNRGFLFAAGMAASRLDPIAAGTLRAAPDDLARLGFAVARALSAGAPPVPGLSGAMEAAAAWSARARAVRAATRDVVVVAGRERNTS